MGAAEGREPGLWREGRERKMDKQAEREWERERSRGDYRRKTLPQSHGLGKEERLIMLSIYNQQSSKTGVL